MMKIARFVLISMFVLSANSAYAGTPVQLWHCEMDDEATEEAVIAGIEKWLEAAKQLDGGEGLEMRVMFPVAVNAPGEYDIWVILTAPSFEDWGKFWDNYPDSDAGDVDDENNELFVCPGSALWDSTPVGLGSAQPDG